MKRFLAWLALSLLITTPASALWHWVELGQAAPRHWVELGDDQEILAIYDRAGSWRTEDGGSTWMEASDRLPGDVPLDSIQWIRPLGVTGDTLLLREGTLPLADGLPGLPLHLSADGGQTWGRVSLGAMADSLLLYPGFDDAFAVSPLDPALWALYLHRELLVTEDCGATWQRLSLPQNYLGGRQLLLSRMDRDRLYLRFGSFDTPYIFRLDSLGGGDWTMLANPDSLFDRIPPDGNLPLQARKIYETPDGVLHAHLTADLVLASDVFLFTQNTMRTLAPGDSIWDYHLFGESLYNQSVSELFWRSEEDGLVWYAQRARDQTVHRSVDGGMNWSASQNGLPAGLSEYGALRRSEATNALLLPLPGRGLYRRHDETYTWWVPPQPPIDEGVENERFLRCYKPGVSLVDRGWRDWWAGMEGDWFEEVYHAPNDTFFLRPHPIACARGGFRIQMKQMVFRFISWEDSWYSKVRFTGSNGATWHERHASVPEHDLLASTFMDMHAVGTEDSLHLLAIYRQRHELGVSTASSDTGASWTYDGRIPYSWHDRFLFTSGDTLVMRSSQPRLKLSYDLGQSWETIPVSMDPWSVTSPPLFVDGEILVVVDSVLWVRGTDGVWSDHGSLPFGGGEQKPVQWDRFPTTSGLKVVAGVSDSAGLWVSEAPWDSWEPAEFVGEAFEDGGRGIWALRYDPFRYRIWVDTGTRVGFYQLFESGVEEQAAPPARFELLGVHPNPFNGLATVRYRLEAPGRVRARLYDLLGREVAVLASGSRPAGTHRLLLDGAHLASGRYFLRLETAGENRTVPVVVLK